MLLHPGFPGIQNAEIKPAEGRTPASRAVSLPLPSHWSPGKHAGPKPPLIRTFLIISFFPESSSFSLSFLRSTSSSSHLKNQESSIFSIITQFAEKRILLHPLPAGAPTPTPRLSQDHLPGPGPFPILHPLVLSLHAMPIVSPETALPWLLWPQESWIPFLSAVDSLCALGSRGSFHSLNPSSPRSSGLDPLQSLLTPSP